MAQTQISDVVVPAEFTAYQVENSLVSTALFQSGVAVPNGEMASQLQAGAQHFTVPFWADAGKVDANINATFSPDGKSIAYVTPQGEIHVVGSDGQGSRKLASPPSPVPYPYALAWSPNGHLIRFTQDNKLYEMSSSGTNLHQLLPGWPAASRKCCGRWTADGNFYLFLSRTGSSPRGQIWALDERRSLLRQPSPEPVQLSSGPLYWSQPVSSRDGSKIFAVGNVLRGELVRFDTPTRQLQPVFSGISAEGVSFSRDGKSIAYVSFPEGILWRANRDGSNPRQLTDPPFYVMNPRWSPDGKQILFADENAAPNPPSYIVDAEGGVPRPMLPGGNESAGDANWSPDGQQIVFQSGKLTDAKSVHLNILDLATQQVTPVPGSTGMFSVRWSPDGRYLAAMSFDHPSLIAYDSQTQQWSQLVTGRVDFPSFSSDSRWLYFLRANGDRGVYRVPVKGGPAERVVDLNDVHTTGYFSFWLGLDPADQPLLLRDIGSTDIYALTLDSK